MFSRDRLLFGARVVWPLLACGATLAAFRSVGAQYVGDYVLDLGSLDLPSIRHAYFLLFWSFFGSLAALFLALALFRLGSAPVLARRLDPDPDPARDRAWIVASTLLACVVPVLLRALVLRGARLTDDESAYLFMAQLLGSGRLTVASPPLKLFFDNVFLINDGRMFTQYFVGWPALMAPGTWLGLAGYMNALYAAAAVPPLFAVLRRLAGSRYARLGMLLYLSAPMLMIAAATGLSHTSCFAALTWAFWLLLRSRDAEAPVWTHAGLAVALCVAFFIRPLSAFGVGAPIVAVWAWARLFDEGAPGARLRRALAFLVPVLGFAALFLLVNAHLSGGPFTSGYQRYLDYSRENGFRFSLWPSDPGADHTALRLHPSAVSLSLAAVALLRLGFSLFGWPTSFLILLPLAALSRRSRLAWACLASFFLANVVATDAGIDSFGPVHYLEAGLPVLLLCVLGAREGARGWSEAGPRERAASRRRLALCAVVALALTSLVGYWPTRLATLRRIAANVNAPFDEAARRGLQRAVVFTPRIFVSQKPIQPTRHFVYARPNNDPDLANDILWVNHVTVARDRLLMRQFPERTGYVMTIAPSGRIDFLALDGLRDGDVPQGLIGGTWQLD